MKKIRIRLVEEPTARDPYAQLLWGRFRHQRYDDRRKRKPKHKALALEW